MAKRFSKDTYPVVLTLIESFIYDGGKYSADLITVYVNEEPVASFYDSEDEKVMIIIEIINDHFDKKIKIRCSRALQGDRITEILELDFSSNTFILHDYFTNSKEIVDSYSGFY